MPALLIRRRRPIGEPTGLWPTSWPFASTIEGTAGAGRICGALLELGVQLDGLTQAVLVEHHPLDWGSTAEATTPTPGAEVGMEEVRRHPPFVSAVSTYDFAGQYVRQPFTARVLSADELAAELAAAGLELVRRRAPTWIEASPHA